MALFNIDIERFYKENESSGKKLKGIFCIQYPIYCIHANIEDATPDPLDNLDRIIMEFLQANPKFTSLQLAALIGSSKKFVELRLEALINDEMLISRNKAHHITQLGSEIFKDKEKKRTHLRSFDFYLDGINFDPLPSIYYSFYRSNFISEHDVSMFTNKKGETIYVKPFGPDLVHTPPDKETIISKILPLSEADRQLFNIPNGLISINEISFTRLSMPLLISTSTSGKEIHKELIDGFAIYSLNETLPYLEFLKQRVQIFLPNIKSKIENLEFRIMIPFRNSDNMDEIKPILTTNWPEIDRYNTSQKRCFNFAIDDLLKLVQTLFNINYATKEHIVNTETDLEINITKKILFESNNRQKLMSDLIRKRDYKITNTTNNVFLLFLYIDTKDPFVLEAVKFKELLSGVSDKRKINNEFLDKHSTMFKSSMRELLVATGEFDILEQNDMREFMFLIN